MTADRPGDGPVPLVVDVDSSLAATNLLLEGLVRLLFTRPHRLPSAFGSLLSGRAAFKARVAELSEIDLDRVPLDPRVEALVEEARGEGRPVILASAAYSGQVEGLARRVGADEVIATDGDTNMKASRKLEEVRRRTEVFDYVGDAAADLPLLAEARHGYLVEPGPVTRFRAARAGDGEGDLTVLSRRQAERLGAWGRALRPHQWAKNALLLLPILAAHMTWTVDFALEVLAGLASFSLLASAVYLLNDLADLPHDRAHPSKRERPVPAGELSIPSALGTVLLLLAASAALALPLPGAFGLTLGAYLLLNLGYSWGLKRTAVLDVILLAALYTIRIVAGAALAEIPLTGWFLAFSIFLFFSLALVKRVLELERSAAPAGGGAGRAGGTGDEASGGRARGSGRPVVAGRGYRPGDLPVLLAVGPATGLVSALVYCLYITDSAPALYARPDLLWIGLPLLLYWIVRIWLLAARGEIEEDDPVVFVLGDPVSYAVLAAFVLVVYLAV